jgi:hypothetical protein
MLTKQYGNGVDGRCALPPPYILVPQALTNCIQCVLLTCNYRPQIYSALLVFFALVSQAPTG